MFATNVHGYKQSFIIHACGVCCTCLFIVRIGLYNIYIQEWYLVHAHLLELLLDLTVVHNYVSGATALAELYHQLGVDAKAKTKQIDRYLSLLEVWLYEHFRRLRSVRCSFDVRHTKDFP